MQEQIKIVGWLHIVLNGLGMVAGLGLFLFFAVLGGAVAASVLGFDLRPAYAQARELKIARTTETRSTCPYCSVSCGVIIHTLGDKAKNVTPQVVHVEGDPDHPINRGTLCPKGASLQQDIVNSRRLLKPQVRRPGGTVQAPIPLSLAWAAFKFS